MIVVATIMVVIAISKCNYREFLRHVRWLWGPLASAGGWGAGSHGIPGESATKAEHKERNVAWS